jgi:hypothetical protein
MATLAHLGSDGFGRGWHARDVAAVIGRAIAAASEPARARRGLVRRFLGARSAAALVRRYRLRPVIECAYERVVRELGPVRVEISAERSAGEEYVAMDCFAACADVERVIDAEAGVQRQVHEALGDRRWLRLLVTIHPGGAGERTA